MIAWLRSLFACQHHWHCVGLNGSVQCCRCFRRLP